MPLREFHRRYLKADLTGFDRDSEFMRFAQKQEKGITFIEGDITSLPFKDNSYDVVIYFLSYFC